MRAMWFSRFIATVIAVIVCASAAAENAGLIRAFGGDPGSPLPHAYSYGLPEQESPHYHLRVPIIDPKLKPVFYDTELTVTRANKIVESVRAARAFRSLDDCHKAREIITTKLAESLVPRAPAGEGGEWYRSEDGQVTASARCESPRHYPMPVLRLDIVRSPVAP